MKSCKMAARCISGALNTKVEPEFYDSALHVKHKQNSII